jgi:hypothetical protein
MNSPPPPPPQQQATTNRILFGLCHIFLYPVRGFPQKYMSCLKESNDAHHKCKDLSRDYLQCRMDHKLMAKEDLNHVRTTERNICFWNLLWQCENDP